GASRFTLVDPAGNRVVFVRRDDPLELDYGGSKDLKGLARVLDNARVLREFKNDDRAAFRAVRSGLRRHGAGAAAVERALALTALIELGTIVGEGAEIDMWRRELREIPLTDSERARVDEGATPEF
ncbi:MAG TPA: glyoxalase, partial [Phytomonospora sp.]